MSKVEIYSSPTCGYCHAAKRLLAHKGIQFDETDVVRNPEKRVEMNARSNGGRTVPQIFINGKHIGGCDDLYALDSAGGLDSMLVA